MLAVYPAVVCRASRRENRGRDKRPEKGAVLQPTRGQKMFKVGNNFSMYVTKKEKEVLLVSVGFVACWQVQ